MAANAPPKPPPKTAKETWADWLPEVEPTLTINDVIERLKARGVDDVTVENIRTWQRDRVLPAPIRRQVGTGKGGIRALYPPQAVDAIARIRPLQRDGVPLRQIKDRLARMADLNTRPAAQVAMTGHPPKVTTHMRTIPQKANVSVEDPAFLEAMTEAARSQEQRVGAPIRRVEVTFTDERDKKHSYVFDL